MNKIKIDKEKCIGCGACQSICPEVFEVVGDKAIIKKQIDTPCVEDALSSCPTGAIERD